MSEALKFVPPRVPLVDMASGQITREWYLFLQGVFLRIGGANGFSTTDLGASLFEDAGSGETNALLFSADQAAGQAPPGAPLEIPDQLLSELAALRSQFAEMTKDIDSIRQGQML